MKNGKIDKYLFEGGYAQATSTGAYTDSFAFNYYNQDHLGNNREVVDASGSIVQVTNYYPFGTPYADASASQNPNRQQFKYNGKELDIMHGLNTYDYGARQNYPILCRWDRMDPLCEKYYNVSPYNYCRNNPVNRVDPDGMTDYRLNKSGQLYEVSTIWEAIKKFFGFGCNQDRIYMEGDDRELVSFPEGTINLLKNDSEITQIEIKDDKSAELFTNMVMKETDVEWSRLMHGKNKSSTSNTIVNNHNDRNVDSAVPLLQNYTKNGEEIYIFDHSHPIPKDLRGTNVEKLVKIKVSEEDKLIVNKYKPHQSRVFNKQTHQIEYYNSKNVYRYEKWK